MKKRRVKNRRLERCRISRRKILWALTFLIAASGFFFVFAVHVLHKEEQKDRNVASVHQQLNKESLGRSAPINNEGGIEQRRETHQETDERLVQEYLVRTMNRTSLPLMAYAESPLQRGRPLPVRKNIQLEQYTYPNIQSCQDVQNAWPVDHPITLDAKFGPNVGDIFSLYPFRDEYASICPVDADPFLPWIHDIFPSVDGKYIEFVAHNKRRCRSGPTFMDDLSHLEPQVAIMQTVPVRRLSTEEREKMTPGWEPSDEHTHRYRLASLEDADEDGRETRFLCQFHTLRPQKSGDVQKVVLGETLSVFPYNYEHANFRKGPKPHPMLSRPKDDQDVHGAHIEQIWNSILHFKCPVPPDLQERIRDGDSVTEDGVPSIYLDLVPIRTPPRETREGYCPQVPSSTFDPQKEWGEAHVVPTVEDSGRWANIPICSPPAAKSDYYKPEKDEQRIENKNPKHYLVGCLWASAAFTTRGAGAAVDTSTSLRLLEWLVYHLYIAKLDHVYVYDNTEAHTNETSLQPVLDLFPQDRVTRIPWKHRVCNNNRPMHINAGERSSQYAAEASCRVRYGPTTEWLISFDTDEYLVPQGNWSSLQAWLKESVRSGKIGRKTHILSFFQTRALPNIEFMEPYSDESKQCRATQGEASCLAKRSNTTYLQTYDCEPINLPKPDFGWRAKKQIYRPNFVLNHFVHYSTVTRRILDAPDEQSPPFIQHKPWERRVDELTEAFLLHTKTTAPPTTKNWKKLCSDATKKCPVGISWPLISRVTRNATNEGLGYNCYQHERIQKELAGRLQAVLGPFLAHYHETTTRRRSKE